MWKAVIMPLYPFLFIHLESPFIYLGISLEILLQSCSDASADVRLNAEECLNRLIKGLYETNVHKILIELYKEVKKVKICMQCYLYCFVLCL